MVGVHGGVGVCMLVVCVVLLGVCCLATNWWVYASLGGDVGGGRGWGQGIHVGNGVGYEVG